MYVTTLTLKCLNICKTKNESLALCLNIEHLLD